MSRLAIFCLLVLTACTAPKKPAHTNTAVAIVQSDYTALAPKTPASSISPSSSSPLPATPFASATVTPEIGLSPTPPLPLPATTTSATSTPWIIATDTPVPDQPAPFRLQARNWIGQANTRFAIYGDHAYIQAAQWLLVVDFSNPEQPQQVNTLPISNEYTSQVVLDGDLLFLSTVRTSSVDYTPYIIDIYDLTFPIAPAIVGNIPIEDMHQFIVAFPYVYIVAGRNLYFPFGLHVMDVSDPEHIQEIAFYELPDFSPETLASNIKVSLNANEVVVAVKETTVRFDVTNPSTPVLLDSSMPLVPSPTPIPETTYYELSPHSLKRFDTTNPESRVLVGEFVRPVFTVSQVAARGDYAYIFTADSRLLIFDFSDLSEPHLAAEYGDQSPAQVFMAGPLLGSISKDAAPVLSLHSLTDPLRPVPVSETHLSSGFRIQEIAVALPYLYIAEAQQLHIIDLSDAHAPLNVGVYQSERTINGLTAVPHAVYLATSDGLTIVDVSDPANPLKTSSLPFVAGESCFSGTQPDRILPTTGVAVAGYVYVVSGDACSGAIDVADPYSPQLVGSWNWASCSFDRLLTANPFIYMIGNCPSMDFYMELFAFRSDSIDFRYANSIYLGSERFTLQAAQGNKVFLTSQSQQGLLVIEAGQE